MNTKHKEIYRTKWAVVRHGYIIETYDKRKDAVELAREILTTKSHEGEVLFLYKWLEGHQAIVKGNGTWEYGPRECVGRIVLDPLDPQLLTAKVTKNYWSY